MALLVWVFICSCWHLSVCFLSLILFWNQHASQHVVVIFLLSSERVVVCICLFLVTYICIHLFCFKCCYFLSLCLTVHCVLTWFCGPARGGSLPCFCHLWAKNAERKTCSGRPTSSSCNVLAHCYVSYISLYLDAENLVGQLTSNVLVSFIILTRGEQKWLLWVWKKIQKFGKGIKFKPKTWELRKTRHQDSGRGVRGRLSLPGMEGNENRIGKKELRVGFVI